MVKRRKHNTNDSSVTKTEKLTERKENRNYAFEDYFSMKDFRMHPISDRFKKELARRLVEWAKKDDSRVLYNFYKEEDIRDTTFARWMETSNDLKEAHAFAKMAISGRLLDGGFTKTYSESLVKWALPLYSQTAKELEEWRAKIGEKVDGATNITVVMEKFPDSPVKRIEKNEHRSE